MKRFLILFLVLFIGISSMPSKSLMTVSAAIDETNDDWLHTDGNKILDMNGNQVILTGCNWFGFNTGTNVFDGVWSCNMKQAIQGMADRGINFLRIPVSTQILYAWSKGTPPSANVNDYVNPELEGMNSLELFDTALQDCKEVGIKVMVDIHCPKSEAMGHTYQVWYDGTYTTEAWISTLEWITERYKNNDTLLALDLKNEPHGTSASSLMAKWDNSTDTNNWKYAAETCAKRILKINPNMLIMVEGIEVYPKAGKDYTAIDKWGEESNYYFNWWGGNLRGVKDYPLNLGQGQDQLVYSPHDYGPMVYKQNWFYDGFTQETLYKDCWEKNWAYIQEENIAPLLIGEWGGFMDGGDNEKWMTALRDYMIDNKVSHTFWCYNANSGDTGGLVGSDFSTWDEEKYALLKPALWQNSDGKFISLDHKVPLGKNGISTSEYYDNTTPVNTPTTTLMPNIYGDANNDKVVDSADYTLFRKSLLGQIKLTGASLDLNDDGVIDSADYTILRKYLLRIITALPI